MVWRVPRRPGIVADMTPKSVSVKEAAEMTGLTEKAIRRRIEGKTLRSLRVGNRVHVYVPDLLAAGLTVNVDAGHEQGGDPDTLPHTSPRGARADLADLVREFTERAIAAEVSAARAQALLESAEKRERDMDAALQSAQRQVIEAEAKAATVQAHLSEAEKRLAALDAAKAEAQENAEQVTPEPDTAGATRAWWRRMLGA